jgi:hypothetical protein
VTTPVTGNVVGSFGRRFPEHPANATASTMNETMHWVEKRMLIYVFK